MVQYSTDCTVLGSWYSTWLIVHYLAHGAVIVLSYSIRLVVHTHLFLILTGVIKVDMSVGLIVV